MKYIIKWEGPNRAERRRAVALAKPAKRGITKPAKRLRHRKA